MCIRVGYGYDVHRLKKGRKLILGGVEIPYEMGLYGHSDADVLSHAIMDALLGAAALGDIGVHFPDNDDKYLGADSLILMKNVWEMLKSEGFRVVNIDSTIICERPRLSGYIQNMRENIALVLGMDVDYVSVKATTSEGLGFTGEGKGIASHAVCLIEKKG